MTISTVHIKWILIIGTALVMPCLLFLPWWLILLWLGCALFRLQILRGRFDFPSNSIKIILGFILVCAIVVTFRINIGLDAAATFIMALFSIKILELKATRDALVLIFLGFIAVAITFLFADTIIFAIYGLFEISLLFAAMISLQQATLPMLASWRMSGILMLWTLPFVVIFFIVIPRIEPLWRVPNPASKPITATGLSNTMSPADIAEIIKSSKKVFRVIFADNVLPKKSLLYWRALTYEDYIDRKWQQNRNNVAGGKWYPFGDPINYSVIMEPHNRYWLFSITAPLSNDANVHATSDFRLYHAMPVNQVFRYQVSSYPNALLEPKLNKAKFVTNIKLPSSGNLRVREFAKKLALQHKDAKSLANAIFNHFKHNGFIYTLTPGKFGTDNIDDFFFNGKQGFCAHYAEAMTFMLRSAGIPARVVAGYQGGQWNNVGNFLQVRESDAHAWVEYWSKDEGWQQIDPTTAVVPTRVFDLDDVGVELATSSNNNLLDQSSLLTRIVDNWDALNHKWQVHILDFEQNQQLSLLKKIFGEVSFSKILLIVFLFIFLSLVLAILWLIKPWQKRHSPLMRIILRFEQIMAKKYNVQRENGETLGNFAQKLITKVKNSKQKQAIYQFTNNLERILYDSKPVNFANLKKQLTIINSNK